MTCSPGGDRWAFFLGDVMGHGVQAAVMTSLIRYTLRSAVMHYPDPVDALGELNRVLLQELTPRRICTVLLCIIEPLPGHLGGFRVVMATGGDEPPLVMDAADATAMPTRPIRGALVGATPTRSSTPATLRSVPVTRCCSAPMASSRPAASPPRSTTTVSPSSPPGEPTSEPSHSSRPSHVDSQARPRRRRRRTCPQPPTDPN